ncbi:methionyl-tRNA formyltransferase [Brachybacterium aquaticum]|uniref:Methionyl-tRNA formyltransferase n=1 Tax=Brachybacterium aquaticum TaxID=1432564 RepID=A0A841ABV8_9MICO|nr:methionyl-tRNA formyltransferase [Brachybacterium aquaticum]MBB5831427.1 methionyl-tRNA formyltransferase [Brachybacterium aquaticum]
MRLLFAGTPEAALPSLRTLLDSRHEVVGVLTRADAPSGRGRKLTPSPVKALALEAGVPVLTPATLRDEAVQQQLRDLAPDAAPVVAYGNLVPAAALDIPRHGWVNLHFSLLPAWRGAAPAQRAVLSGEHGTGMSVFRLEKGLDTGDVIATAPTTIGEFETSGELLDRMAEDGASLLLEALDALEDGTATFTPQDHDAATHAAKLTPAEARIDWTRPASEVGALIRGMSPQPGAWTLLDGARTKLLGIEAIQDASRGAVGPLAPGEIGATKRQVLVGTGTDLIAVATLAPAGKKAMRAADWARGASLAPHTRFETEQDGERA